MEPLFVTGVVLVPVLARAYYRGSPVVLGWPTPVTSRLDQCAGLPTAGSLEFLEIFILNRIFLSILKMFPA